MKLGRPTGAAMPLCWAHAEYLSLVRSRHDGVPFDRVEAAYHRYVVNRVRSRHEIWTLRHPIRRIPQGKTLRVILPADAVIVWTTDNWKRSNESEADHLDDLNLWFLDLPTAELTGKSQVEFTFFWTREKQWEGRNFRVEVVESVAGEQSTPAQSTESVPSKEVSNRSEQSPTPVH
jgi:glucoamylase